MGGRMTSGGGCVGGRMTSGKGVGGSTRQWR